MITHAVAGYDLEHLVVVRAGAANDRPERRRRKCLERLLHELETKAVDDIVLESRGPADDRRDIEMLNALRGSTTCPPRPGSPTSSAASSPCSGFPTLSAEPSRVPAPATRASRPSSRID